jgi:hypothetical protein
MVNFTQEQVQIEKKEYEILEKLNYLFKDSLDIFNSGLKDSMRYINYITLPIIMASLEEKSFNPFSEVIEKHISYIINNKMIASGSYKMLPLDYSSDLSLESNDHIIHLDIKTANLNNPSDFKDTIALGFNQTSYPGKLPSGIWSTDNYCMDGINEVKAYPILPEEYKVNGKIILCLTYGLLFIYPAFEDIINRIRQKYIEIRKVFDNKLIDLFKGVFSNQDNIVQFLNYKPSNEKFKRRELIIGNLIRAYFIHNKKELKLNHEEKIKLEEFSKKVIQISDELIKREIKPVAIISISIPNGKLSPHYDSQIVSGKSFGTSIRYHYEEGIFKGLDGEEKSRVVFIDYNKEYLPQLKVHFNKIITYNIVEKEN